MQPCRGHEEHGESSELRVPLERLQSTDAESGQMCAVLH